MFTQIIHATKTTRRIAGYTRSFGIVSAELDGMFVSDKFPTYAADLSRVALQYLRWYFRYPAVWNQAKGISKGAAALSKLTLNPSDFGKLTVPLPPLAEQRRLVEWIDALAAKIDEAKTLQSQVGHGLDGVCRSIIQNSSDGRPTPTPMAQLVRLRQPDVDVKAEETYHFAGVYCFGRGIFVGQRKSGMEFKYRRLTRLRTGNFVYPKLMAWEGALGIVPPECDGLVVSTEFPVFEIDDHQVLPEVLDVYFRTPSVWPELSGASTGTNVRRRRLNPGEFLRYEFPLPPMTTQLKLREVTRRAEEVRRHRDAASKNLDALLPAILDRAFRGELG